MPKGTPKGKRLPRPNVDLCKCCGSDSLFSGFYDADDLAVPDDRLPGSRWTTFCNDCGTEQT